MKNIITKFFMFLLCSSIFAEIAILKDNCSLHTEENGVLKFAIAVPAGILLNGNTAVFKKDLKINEEIVHYVEFYKVEYNNLFYFVKVDDSEYAEAAIKCAVIKEKATLFETSRPSSFTSSTVEAGTLVIINEENILELKNKKLSFTDIVFWDSQLGKKNKKYVQVKKISTDNNDFQAISNIYLSKIKNEEKKEFAQKALDLAVSPKIKEYALEYYNLVFGIEDAPKKGTSSFSDDEIELKEFSGKVSTKSANINVRNKPGLSGEKNEILKNGVSVKVSIQTTSSSTIDGITAPWYFVTNDDETISGWVFGGYIIEK